MAHVEVFPPADKKSSTESPTIHPSSAANREQLGEDRWKITPWWSGRFWPRSPPTPAGGHEGHLQGRSESMRRPGASSPRKGGGRSIPTAAPPSTNFRSSGRGRRSRSSRSGWTRRRPSRAAPLFPDKLIQAWRSSVWGPRARGTRSSRSVITRKYIEGNPLRPSLVGRAVIQSLERARGYHHPRRT